MQAGMLHIASLGPLCEMSECGKDYGCFLVLLELHPYRIFFHLIHNSCLQLGRKTTADVCRLEWHPSSDG